MAQVRLRLIAASLPLPLRAHEHAEAAERAKDEMKRELGKHLNAPAEALGRMRGVHEAKIRHHEKQAHVHARRAEFARAGYVVDSPDERMDSEHQRAHAELIAMAHRTGRLRHSDESLIHAA
jgi:hypothetical protein